MRYSPDQVREILRLDKPSDPGAVVLQLVAKQVPGMADPLLLSVATFAFADTEEAARLKANPDLYWRRFRAWLPGWLSESTAPRPV